jgi:hypothetical protein
MKNAQRRTVNVEKPRDREPFDRPFPLQKRDGVQDGIMLLAHQSTPQSQETGDEADTL